MKTNTKMMKNLFRYGSGLIPFFLLLTAKGNAQTVPEKEEPVLKVQYLKEDKDFLTFIASVSMPEGKTTMLKISNQSKELLYSERITKTEFLRVYKFPKQEDGEIKFILTGGKEPISKNFAIATKTEERYVINEVDAKN